MFCAECGKENADNANYCVSCGNRIADKDNSMNYKIIDAAYSEMHLEILLLGVNCIFKGRDRDFLSRDLSPKYSTKDMDKILYNIYCAKDYLIIVPVSIGRGAGSLWTGLAIAATGATALAAGAMAALDAHSDKVNRLAAAAAHDAGHSLHDAIFFRTDQCRIVAKDVKAPSFELVDYFKKDRVTWIKVEGGGVFLAKTYALELYFVVGQPKEKGANKFHIIDDICRHTGKVEIPIGKNEYP